MVEKDELYFRLLRELSSPSTLRRSGLESFAELSKKLGVDDQTVRSSVKRMYDSGFLKGWSVILNPHIFNMEAQSVILESKDSTHLTKKEVLSQLTLVDGVAIIFEFLDEVGFRVILYYKDEIDLGRKIQLLSTICKTSSQPVMWKLVYPQIRMKLKLTDWKLIKMLLRNSRESASDIAAEIGISTRTVRRRLALLAESHVFFVDPVVDFKQIDGFLYLFIVSFFGKKEKNVADQVLSKSLEPVVFIDTTAEAYTVIAAICQNISQANQIFSQLGRMKGAKEVYRRS